MTSLTLGQSIKHQIATTIIPRSSIPLAIQLQGDDSYYVLHSPNVYHKQLIDRVFNGGRACAEQSLFIAQGLIE